MRSPGSRTLSLLAGDIYGDISGSAARTHFAHMFSPSDRGGRLGSAVGTGGGKPVRRIRHLSARHNTFLLFHTPTPGDISLAGSGIFVPERIGWRAPAPPRPGPPRPGRPRPGPPASPSRRRGRPPWRAVPSPLRVLRGRRPLASRAADGRAQASPRPPAGDTPPPRSARRAGGVGRRGPGADYPARKGRGERRSRSRHPAHPASGAAPARAGTRPPAYLIWGR